MVSNDGQLRKTLGERRINSLTFIMRRRVCFVQNAMLRTRTLAFSVVNAGQDFGQGISDVGQLDESLLVEALRDDLT